MDIVAGVILFIIGYIIYAKLHKVAIFDDMLEITSPGLLPDNLPPTALGSGRSEIRNRILAPIFKDLKLIEAWGTGIQKMRLETEKYPEIELTIKEIDNAFQIQFINTMYEKAYDEQAPNKYRASKTYPLLL